jgi:hypothetical protein
MELRELKRITALCLAVSAALVAVGCRNLKVNEKPTVGIALPKSQMESDSVAVRVAIAELDELQESSFRKFIETTDSQKISLPMRQRLDENGIRVSVISSVNSAQLQRLLAPLELKHEWLSEQEIELLEAGKLEPVHRLTGQRHVEKKRGESFCIEVSPVQPSATWRVHVGERTYGDRATLAQCQVRVTSWPQPDGSVQLQFMPEIHHGRKLSRIGVSDRNLAVEERRDIKEFRSLAFDVSIQPGETVIVAPTGKLERLGKLFFGADPEMDVDEDQRSQLVSDLSEEDPFVEELFPMLNEDQIVSDPAVLVQDDGLKDIELSTKNERPKPWQRFLLVRVVEVTTPTAP